MTNKALIEIKAKCENLSIIREKLKKLGAKKIGVFKQVDTYFNVKKGRLKIREVRELNKSKIVYYLRPDVKGPKRSDIIILELDKKYANELKKVLAKAVGVKIVVRKLREIYKYLGAQIHLDEVEDLGYFVEIELPIPSANSFESYKNIVKSIIKELGISEQDLIEGSYSDLLSSRTK